MYVYMYHLMNQKWTLVFLLLFYRRAPEAQLVWNPTAGSANSVETSFCKFRTKHTHQAHIMSSVREA